MGLYRAVILVATALVFVVNVTQAGVCQGRSTVLQIKIPNRTNVTIQYPNQNNPVEFVPYPYQQPGSSNKPECYTCRGSKCQRCDRVDPNSHHSRPPSYTKTNIIIDLTRDQSDKSQNGKDGNDSVKNGTVIILQDDNAASSTSGSSAKGGKGTSASSSASTSIANTDIIASLNEKASVGKSHPGNTEDIYVLDASKSASASLSSASAGDKQKDQPHPAKNSPTSQPASNPTPSQPSPQQPSPPNTGSPSNNQPDTSSPDQGSPSNNQPSPPNQGSPANQQPSSDDKSKPSQPDQQKHDPEDSPSDPHEKVDKVKAEVDAQVTAKASSTH